MASALLTAILLAAADTPSNPAIPDAPRPPAITAPNPPEPLPSPVPPGASAPPDARITPTPTPSASTTRTTPPQESVSPTAVKLPPRATRKATTAPGTDDDQPVVTPPSLTKKAFETEVTRSRNQRSRLERLAAEIAAARASLKEETAHLEDLSKRPPAPQAGGQSKPTEKPSVEKSGVEKEAQEKASIDTLAKTLKGMRPEPAAAVVSRLDKRLAVALLRRLRPADAAAIAEKLKPETAAELFALVAHSEHKESP